MTEKRPPDKRIVKGTVFAGGVTPKTPPPPAPSLTRSTIRVTKYCEVCAREVVCGHDVAHECVPDIAKQRIHDALLLAEQGVVNAQHTTMEPCVEPDWTWVQSQFRAIVRALDGEV